MSRLAACRVRTPCVPSTTGRQHKPEALAKENREATHYSAPPSLAFRLVLRRNTALHFTTADAAGTHSLVSNAPSISR